MYKKFAMSSLLMCACLTFASWTSNGSQVIVADPPTVYSDLEFFRDAYSFKLRNNQPIPEYYYDKLNIENPNTPQWAKVPATEPLVPVRVSPIPQWILVGMLMRETKSYYDENGNIVYIDKTNGTSRERGPFQITPIAFKQIKKKGEIHSKVKKDMVYAQEMTERYLMWLYNGPANGNWDKAIRMYNGGPSRWRLNDTLEYLKDVKIVGNKN